MRIRRQDLWNSVIRRTTAVLVSLGLMGYALGSLPLKAVDVRNPGGEKSAVAKNASAKGLLLRRDGGIGKPWIVLDEKESIPSGQLLLGLPGAMIDSANGAVHMNLRADLDQSSPHPIIENAVVLQENSKVDLDFVLDRGRVDVTNTKKQGAAQVRVHVRKQSFDLTLEEPGARAALEVYGRWPRGVRFTKTPGPKDVPTTELIFLVLAGQVNFKHETHTFAMKAPPGPAMIEWDSVSGMDEAPEQLKELPPWASSGDTGSELGQKRKAVLTKLSKAVATKPIHEVLEEFLKSNDPTERHVAVYTLAATDDLAALGKALRETRNADVWDRGVLALRHWIGRGPGQDQILYQGLINNKYTPVQAETVLQLLHSFSDEDSTKPELYHTLIDYLDNDNLAIRGLAYWHLYRLAPEGRKFGFHPLDDKKERAAAISKWKQLIPVGKVPPKPSVDGEKH
ncbi:MAG: hypothetical protein ACJ8FY_24210 [Gemmataceae bacterium]